MDQDDLAEFDGAHAELEKLRATSGGAELLAHIEASAKTTAQSIWTVAEPILEAAGKAGISIGTQALANYATSMLQNELGKLGKFR